MDINRLDAICEHPPITGKQLDEFIKKLNILTEDEIKASFKICLKDMLNVLDQENPCVGCRRRYTYLRLKVKQSENSLIKGRDNF